MDVFTCLHFSGGNLTEYMLLNPNTTDTVVINGSPEHQELWRTRIRAVSLLMFYIFFVTKVYFHVRRIVHCYKGLLWNSLGIMAIVIEIPVRKRRRRLLAENIITWW